jgi:trk system potassium uptake protein TrkA
MHIIIVGAGTVGFHLAKHLSGEGHDIFVIDSNPERIQEIEESKTLDVIAYLGNGGSPDKLSEAGVEKADLLVAVTDSDETNIIACMIASTLGVERRIARVRSHEYFKRNSVLQPVDLGIDLLINPEEEAAREIGHLLERPYASERKIICNGKLELVGLSMEADCPIVGKPLKDIASIIQEDFRISLILRNGLPVIPGGQTVVEAADRIFFMALTEDVDGIVSRLNVQFNESSNIFIVGGGNIGISIAKKFEDQKKKRIKLIENKKEKALKLSEVLSKTLVLEGDGTNIDLLLSEGFKEADAFVSVTNNEETNILACLLAKQQGVHTVIALVQRADYLQIINRMAINVISPRALTVDKILKFVRGEKVLSISTLADDKAEVLEFKVSDSSKVCGKMLKRIKFPADVVFGAIIRKKQPIIPTGSTVIMEGDHVFVFALKSAIDKIGKLF